MISLSFTQNKTKVGALVFDALVSEQISLEGEVTLYPVEDGTVITDHIFQGAERLRISGLISATDIAAFSFSAGGKTRLVEAIDVLRSMHKERALITVSTGIQQYTDMGIASLNAVRSNDHRGGNFLDVRIELVKVRKVTLKTAEVPEAPAQGPAKGRAGQTNKPAGKSSASSTAAPAAAGSGQQNVTPAYRLFNGSTDAAKKLLDNIRAQYGLPLR